MSFVFKINFFGVHIFLLTVGGSSEETATCTAMKKDSKLRLEEFVLPTKVAFLSLNVRWVRSQTIR